MTDMPPYLDKKDEDSNSENSDSDDTCSDIDDWDLPLCFDKPRHLETIKGAERLEHTWRVKEKRAVPERPTAKLSNVLNAYQRLLDHGSFQHRHMPRDEGEPAYSQNLYDDALRYFNEDPRRSTHDAAHFNISQYCAWKIVNSVRGASISLPKRFKN
ncbi:hypothetical protein ACJJTC_007207 [Scirpophaga incertulas]